MKKKKDKITIIIPTYKSIDTLDRLFTSLQAQTYKDFNIILAVDADDEIYEEFKYKYHNLDVTIKYYTENLGPGMTRQRAMDDSKDSDYFIFIDADDIVNPRMVECLYNLIKTHKTDFACSGINRVNKDGSILDILPSVKDHFNLTWCHGKIYSGKYLRKNKIRFRDDLRANEDSYFNCILYNKTDNVICTDEVTYLWMYREDSITSSRDIANMTLVYETSIKAMLYTILDMPHCTDKFFASKLVQMYEMREEAKHNNIYNEQADDIFKLLDGEVEVKKFVDENISLITPILHSSGFYDGKEYLYKQTFIDFINAVF